MKTIKVKEDPGFTGYPSGKRRDFVRGEVADVPNDFADLVVEKGHATLVEPEPASARAEEPKAALAPAASDAKAAKRSNA